MRKSRAELAAADPATLSECERAWRDYFRDHPEVLASWRHQNGYWPMLRLVEYTPGVHTGGMTHTAATAPAGSTLAHITTGAYVEKLSNSPTAGIINVADADGNERAGYADDYRVDHIPEDAQ